MTIGWIRKGYREAQPSRQRTTLQREMGGWGRPLKSLWSSHPAAPPLGPPAPPRGKQNHYTPALAAAKLNLLWVLTHSFLGVPRSLAAARCRVAIRRHALCGPAACPASCPPRTRQEDRGTAMATRLATSKVAARYGVSRMTIWRWQRDHAKRFSPSICLFWRLSDLEAFERSRENATA
jgi:hypothetical protein